MRTLLRHKQSGTYFRGPDRWTDDPEEAYDFRFVQRAAQYIETWHLDNVELVFAFSGPVSITTMVQDKPSAWRTA
jgi:hypothetical protein